MTVIYGPTGIPDLNSLYNDLYEPTLTIAEHEGIMPKLVKGFDDSDTFEDRVASERPQVEMEDVDEADDYQAPQKFGKAEIARLTPGEKMGQFKPKWRLMRQDPTTLADIKKAFGLALARKIDRDMISLFPTLNGGAGATIGGAGVTAGWSYLSAAQVQLYNSAVGDHYAVVLHPFSTHAFSESLGMLSDFTNVPDSVKEALTSKWYIGSIQNMHFFSSPLIPVDGAGDAIGAMFAMEAMALDTRTAPNLLMENDASDRSTEMNWQVDYAYGLWRADYGIPLKFDASTPTGAP
jgi:hypothetical protein